MADIDSTTSIKGLFQSLATKDTKLYQGTVTSVSPLQIQVTNDSSLIISEANIYVPRHLTDYQTTIDIATDGSLNASISSDGAHTHTYSTTSGTGGAHGHMVTGSVGSSGDHTHTESVSVSGTTGSGGDPEHTHTFSASQSGNTGTAGSHTHEVSVTAESADGHTHAISGTTASQAAHNHSLTKLGITGATITIHNALRVGDTVHLLSLLDGKMYYVLDRV